MNKNNVISLSKDSIKELYFISRIKKVSQEVLGHKQLKQDLIKFIQEQFKKYYYRSSYDSTQLNIDEVVYNISRSFREPPSSILKELSLLNKNIDKINTLYGKDYLVKREIGELAYKKAIFDDKTHRWITCYYTKHHSSLSDVDFMQMRETVSSKDFDIHACNSLFHTPLTQAIIDRDFDKFNLLASRNSNIKAAIAPLENYAITTDPRIFSILVHYLPKKQLSEFEIETFENLLLHSNSKTSVGHNLNELFNNFEGSNLMITIENAFACYSSSVIKLLLSNRNVIEYFSTNTLKETRFITHLCLKNYVDLFLQAALYKKISTIKVLCHTLPEEILDISLPGSIGRIQAIFKILITSHHRSYTKFFIHLIIRKNNLTRIHEIRELMRGLTSSPYYNDYKHFNPLLTCFILNKLETAKLLMKYGAEVPIATQSEETYKNDNFYDHPMMYCLNNKLGHPIRTLHQYGVLLPFSKEDATYAHKFDLLNTAIKYNVLECAEIIRKILVKEKRLTNEWLKNYNLYINTAFEKPKLEVVRYVFDNKLYDKKEFCFLDYCESSLYPKSKISLEILKYLLSKKVIKLSKETLLSNSLIKHLALPAVDYCYNLCNKVSHAPHSGSGNNILHEALKRSDTTLDQFKTLIKGKEELLSQKNSNSRYPVDLLLENLSKSNLDIVLYILKNYNDQKLIRKTDDLYISYYLITSDPLKNEKVLESLYLLKKYLKINVLDQNTSSYHNFIEGIVCHGNLSLLKALQKDYKVNLNIMSLDGNTLLHHAKDASTLKYTLENCKHSLSTLNNQKETPYDQYCKKQIFSETNDNVINTLKFYKQKGYDVNNPLPDGTYPIHHYFKKHCFGPYIPDLSKLLDFFSISLLTTDKEGNNSLHYAAKNLGIFHLVQFLEKHLSSCKLNHTNKREQNFLHILFSRKEEFLFPKTESSDCSKIKNFRKLMSLLKKNNFNFSQKDSNNKTPLDYLKESAPNICIKLYSDYTQ